MDFGLVIFANSALIFYFELVKIGLWSVVTIFHSSRGYLIGLVQKKSSFRMPNNNPGNSQIDKHLSTTGERHQLQISGMMHPQFLRVKRTSPSYKNEKGLENMFKLKSYNINQCEE